LAKKDDASFHQSEERRSLSDCDAVDVITFGRRIVTDIRVESTVESGLLEPAALLKSAKELFGFLSDQAVIGDARGRLTDECVRALRNAGLFAIFIPKDLRGAELSPLEGLEIVEILSRADGSTGWVVMATQVSMASCAAFLTPSVTKKIFKPHIPLIAGHGAPMGKAHAESNGYRLSGNWSYGSGLQHSEWIHSGAIVYKNGEPTFFPGTKYPHARIFIVPIAEAELKDNWDVLGLRASGSVDYSIRDAFVPEEYTHLLSANRPYLGGDLYRLGILGLATIGHTGVSLGIARRMLDEISALATASSGRPTSLSTRGGGEAFQLQYGQAEARLHAARAFAYDIWGKIQVTLAGGNDPTVRQVTLARLAFLNANSVATAVANFGFEFGGGIALRAGKIQRCFRDQRAAAQHFTASEPIFRECAKELLGLAEGKIWSVRELVDFH
jgi:alkylation response protein AidB-like acyl-CoA dehydrogenase